MVLKKKWIGPGLVVAVAAAVTVGLLAFTGAESPRPSSSRDPATFADVEIPQAPWRVKTYPAGAGRSYRKADRKLVERQKKRLEKTVTTVIDALVLSPESLRELSGSALSRAAAKALMRSDLALPKKVEDVRTMKRQAQIGIHYRGSKRAAVGVTVRLRARVDGKKVKLLHSSNLFLQKRNGQWQVIAFDGTRRRLG
jgi:hypothetical protein